MAVSKIKKKFPKGVILSQGVLQENLMNFSKNYAKETSEFLKFVFGDFAEEIYVYVKEPKNTNSNVEKSL